MTSQVAYVADPAALAQTLFDLIDAAEESVVLQMYLFAGNHDLNLLLPRPGIFPWAELLADRLIAKKQRSPGVEVVVILDTQTPDDARLTRKKVRPLVRHRLEEAGIPVLNANLWGTRFNPRRRFPPAAGFHAQDHQAVPQDQWVQRQQAWQTWHNVEDHRKNLVIDRGRWGALTSRNAIDVASDWHDNLLLVGGEAGGGLWDEVRFALRDALLLPQRMQPEVRARVERLLQQPAVEGTGAPLPRQPSAELRTLGDPTARPDAVPARAEVIPSSRIRIALEQAIDQAPAESRIHVASTYFAEVSILERLLAAARRGVQVRVLIDDCHALPLPPFESWFVRTFVNLRCLLLAARGQGPRFELRVHASGHGAMMHLKTAAFVGEQTYLLGGQANYTRNTLDGAWLDTVVRIEAPQPVADFLRQFEPLWERSVPVRPHGTLARMKASWLLGLLAFAEWLGFRP